ILSGILLARKFHSASFVRALQDEARSAVTESELQQVLHSGIAAVPPAKLEPLDLDFAHGFHFAPGRWD
ncbi:MAG: hypothetical protein KGR26_06965, partial [Cyanobacteria bacterium REEB65]|nr:hypothetical protein [Cyanobacteria bacterium REEB65]